MQDQILLTRQQIEQMHELSRRFPEVNDFTLEMGSSGIGPVLKLKFCLFRSDTDNVTVDITDVTTW
jgi:hypothetical protein